MAAVCKRGVTNMEVLEPSAQAAILLGQLRDATNPDVLFGATAALSTPTDPS